MSMRGHLKIERVDRAEAKAVIHRLDGTLSDLDEAYQLLDAVRKEVEQGATTIVLNMAKVERVNSAGVGILAACYSSAKGAGARLCLVSCSPRVRTLVDLVGLWRMLEIFDDEESALKAGAK